MPSRIDILRNEMAALEKEKEAIQAKRKAILDAADQDEREPSDDEMAQIRQHNKDYKSLEGKLELKGADLKELLEIQSAEKETARNAFKKADPQRVQVEEPVFPSLNAQMRAIAIAGMGGEKDPRLANAHKQIVYEAAASGAAVEVPSDGGFLVQTQYSRELLDAAREESQLLQFTRRVTIQAPYDSMQFPMLDASDRSGGAVFGGVYMYWGHEGDSVTASKPKLRMERVQLEKLMGLAYATNELVERGNIGELFRNGFASAASFMIDNGIVRGTGAGEMQGILNAPSLITVAAETGQDAATIVYKNIVNMYAQLYSRDNRRLVWLANKTTFPQLAFMTLPVGTGGVAVFMPANQAAGMPYQTLMGIPIIWTEKCSALGTVGDIVLADLGQYAYFDQGMLDVATSIHVKFITDEMAFRFKMYANGMSLWDAARTPYLGDDLSPFVALATRS